MKKIVILFSILMMVVGLNAQTVVKEDVVKSYTYTDTLEVDSSYSGTVYYVKDFADNVRFQLTGDSIAAGYTKLQGVLLGSLDAVNYFTVGDTITLAANGADSDVVVYTNVFYNYLKPKVTAIDSTQYSEFSWKLLIDKN